MVGLGLKGWRRAKWQQLTKFNATIADRYQAQRGLFMPAELATLLGPALSESSILTDATHQLASAENELLAGQGPERSLASVSRLETRVYLGSQLLRDLDVMSMAHSLEVRVPFVDHVLLESIWPALGEHPRLLARKRLLYETLELPLPSATVNRPKQGFVLPFQHWMGGELQEVVRGGLDELERQRWVTKGTSDVIWRSWRAGDSHWSRPWALGILGHFLRQAA